MIKLEERQIYQFRIVKLLFFSEKEHYYIVRDPFGDKHLIPVKYYTSYNLQVGEDFTGYIDKINCKGGIFIEPEHPFYKIGNIYEFFCSQKTTQINRKGKKFNAIIITDNFKLEHTAIVTNRINYFTQNKQTVKCQIERIKKGRIYLVKIIENE